jgi:hypothetical protein
MTAAQLEQEAHKQQVKIREAKAELEGAQQYLLEIHATWRVRGFEERLAGAEKKLDTLHADGPPDGPDGERWARRVREVENELVEVRTALEFS